MGVEDDGLAGVSAFGEGEGDGGEENLVFLGRMGVDWWAGGIVEESARVAAESEEVEGDVFGGSVRERAADAVGRDHTGGGKTGKGKQAHRGTAWPRNQTGRLAGQDQETPGRTGNRNRAVIGQRAGG